MRYFLLVMSIILTPAWLNAAELQETLDEVVVTASRVAEKVKEAPVTINVIDNKEIEKVKFRSASEILTRLPGVITQDLSGGSELTSIRVPTGFTNPYTIVLLDGVPVSSYGSGSAGQFSEINNDNIARVEVIKGPASALYGSNAIGGVINIISKDPSPKSQVKLWSEYGKGDMLRSGVSGSGSGEKMSFNVDANYLDSEGWRDNSAYDQKSSTVKLQFLPNNASLIAFKVDYLTSNVERPGTLSKEDFETDWQHSKYDITYNDKEKIAPSLTYNHFFDQAEFKATLALRDIESEGIPTYGIRYSRTGFPATYYHSGRFDQNEDQAANLQFLYSHSFNKQSSKIIVGLDGEQGTKKADKTPITPILQNAASSEDDYTTGDKYISYTLGTIVYPITTPYESIEIDTEIYAPFIQYQFSPVDKMKITAGGRYDSAKYDVDVKIDESGTKSSGEQEFTAFSPKLGATYDFTSRINTYFSYSQGFVVPTTSQLFTAGDASNPNLEAEEAENYEIGMRSSFLDNKLGLDLAIYTMDVTNKIVSSGTSSWSSDPYINAGETSQDGLEATAVIIPLDMVRLTLAYSFAESKYDVYSLAQPEYNGKDTPMSPKHRLNARLAVMPIKGLEVELEMDEVSTQYHDTANEFEYSRPTLFHLRTTYDKEQYSAWIHIKNLTDQTYATRIGGSGTVEDLSFHPGEPLSVFAGL
ncbi:TonB-dependent receptor, partial [bacterium]|nr:TonB-dependent receptor [bacterium]